MAAMLMLKLAGHFIRSKLSLTKGRELIRTMIRRYMVALKCFKINLERCGNAPRFDDGPLSVSEYV